MDTQGKSRSWLRGLGLIEWPPDEQSYAALLDTLTRDRLEMDLVERERTATARQEMGDVIDDHEEIAEEELERARGGLGTFRAALEDARARGGPDGREEVPYDSANPVEDAQADALIQYVMRPGFAQVRTDELGSGRYVYWIRVDWDGLRRVAAEEGHPLPL